MFILELFGGWVVVTTFIMDGNKIKQSPDNQIADYKVV